MPAADTLRRACLGAALLALAAQPSARAQDPLPVELTWRAPAGCPRAGQVLERVRKLVGAVGPSATPLRVLAAIERIPNGELQLSLETQSGELVGQRSVAGRQCEDLANAAAIHIALLLREAAEPAPAATPTSPQASPAAAPAADGGSTQPQPPSRGPAPGMAEVERDAIGPAAPRTLYGLLQIPLGVLSIGPLPRPVLGASLAAGLRSARWEVLLEGVLWRTQRLDAPTEPGLGAALNRVSAGLRGCFALTRGTWALAACGQLDLEHLWAQGSGPHLSARTSRTTWLAPGLGAQVRLEVTSWLGLLARVDAQLESARPKLTVDGLGDLGKLGPLAIRLTLGADWIL